MGVGVDVYVQVVGGVDGVVCMGADLEGGLVVDGDPYTKSVSAIPAVQLVAVWDVYGDVGCRGVVPPGQV